MSYKDLNNLPIITGTMIEQGYRNARRERAKAFRWGSTRLGFSGCAGAGTDFESGLPDCESNVDAILDSGVVVV